MPRTIWFALFCVAVLAAMMTIKIATTPALLAIAGRHDQTAIGIALAPNTAAKWDRLPLPDIHQPTEAEPVPPVATTEAVETPSSGLETTDRTIEESTRNTLDAPPQKGCASALAKLQRQADCRPTAASPACEGQIREDKC